MQRNQPHRERRVPHYGHPAEWEAASQQYQPDARQPDDKGLIAQIWGELDRSPVKTRLQILATETGRLQRRVAELYPELVRSQQRAA
jgi:hypothetical protein